MSAKKFDRQMVIEAADRADWPNALVMNGRGMWRVGLVFEHLDDDAEHVEFWNLDEGIDPDDFGRGAASNWNARRRAGESRMRFVFSVVLGPEKRAHLFVRSPEADDATKFKCWRCGMRLNGRPNLTGLGCEGYLFDLPEKNRELRKYWSGCGGCADEEGASIG